MNYEIQKKLFFTLVFSMFVLLTAVFTGCSTTQRIMVSGKTVGTEQADNTLSKLSKQQTESAVTAQKIADSSNCLENAISDAVTELENGTEAESEFRTIIQQIESRQPVNYNKTDSSNSTDTK